MPKILCISGIVIAVLILILFVLDLAIGFPFQRINLVMDIVFMTCALALGYLGWSTLREQD
jgi:threonine/homoserine/homoserine lactone efflux protein